MLDFKLIINNADTTILVRREDRLFCHSRSIIIQKYDDELDVTVQRLLAEDFFTTKNGADRWVNQAVTRLLADHGILVYP